MEDKKMYLVAVRVAGLTTKIVKEGVPKILQAEKSRLIKSGFWKGYVFQLRNTDAYPKVPVLYDKKTGGLKK